MWLFPDFGTYHRLLRMETLPVTNQPGRIKRRYTAYCGARLNDIGWYRSELAPTTQPYCAECYTTE